MVGVTEVTGLCFRAVVGADEEKQEVLTDD